jgi:hypothetical protein
MAVTELIFLLVKLQQVAQDQLEPHQTVLAVAERVSLVMVEMLLVAQAVQVVLAVVVVVVTAQAQETLVQAATEYFTFFTRRTL